MDKYYKKLINKIVQLNNNQGVSNVLSEVGNGLLIVWLLGILLELWRSGLVSLYLDLNIVLVLGIICLLVGRQPTIKSTYTFYLTLALSILLAMLIYLKL